MLTFERHRLDVEKIQTVASDLVSGACFQEDSFYNHRQLRAINFHDEIKTIAVEPGYELCLYKDKLKNGNKTPDCCFKVAKEEQNVKVLEVWKDDMFYNSDANNRVSNVVVSDYNKDVPYKIANTPQCGK